MHLGEPRLDGEDLLLDVGVSARVRTAESWTSRKAPPLPDNKPLTGDSGFMVASRAEIPYHLIDRLLNDQLGGKEFQMAGGRRSQVEHVAVHGVRVSRGNRRLVLEAGRLALDRPPDAFPGTAGAAAVPRS